MNTRQLDFKKAFDKQSSFVSSSNNISLRKQKMRREETRLLKTSLDLFLIIFIEL